MHRYYLEFILNMRDDAEAVLRNSIIEFGEDLQITPVQEDNPGKGKNFKIHIYTLDPTIIFDTCSQFGRIKSVKISEDIGYAGSD
jgi:dihydroxyacetone kinase-like predicted kinase